MRGAAVLAVLAAAALAPAAHADVSIILDRPVYGYCDRLLYTIVVSEVTGDPAIIHIRDSGGRAGSAVPVAVTGPETVVPAPVPFGPEIFETGTYSVGVEYAGEQAAASFELADLGKLCLPGTVRPVVQGWLAGGVPDGFLIDAFARFVDPAMIRVPFEADPAGVTVPAWLRNTAHWWLQDRITDAEFAGAVDYLLGTGVISPGRGASA